ncbi:hypothetical protein L228DRAFT_266751 [Xylona heveae TC161]|uniref:Metallo-beta-lactamase domain-containing protein n=1 Tax=Xylona heveae (strain CBS 132557 / TC161) TaxID=1328760 RepID=A0A165I5B8_XYLHT|nr:hypothetical protein L228DRAFT_266751 [Xylona heveae TC161]KZF24408.1 hypothetical protein L228DRAFT_266751 [Xylona heveae TC161]
MSLTIKHLNADASFLLTFQPFTTPAPTASAHGKGKAPAHVPGSFSIVIDPWLSGSVENVHPKVQYTRNLVPSCISSLKELAEAPDVVLISQAKSDHCHEETLVQLPTTGKKTTYILAEPAAAKKIKGWKHFLPSLVHPLEAFDEKKKDKSLHRFTLPALHQERGTPGEVAIAFIPDKWDMTGLHNAVGITYRAPTATGRKDGKPGPCLSIIYTPHGIPYPLLERYVSSHLAKEGALPLSLLLHSFDRVENPWWLGGTLLAGLPGGIDIAKNLYPRAWISAHDGEKENRGAVVHNLKTVRYSHTDVEAALKDEYSAHTDVLVMEPGAEYKISVA